MFAYCNNNPVNFEDSSGCALKPCMTFVNVGARKTPGPIGTIGSDYYAELNNYYARHYVMNDDEQVALEAERFSYYKGAPVVKVPNNIGGFSFGLIFLGDGNKYDDDGIATLNHEYGHYVHLSQIGMQNYFTKVAVPSLIGYWSGVVYSAYFSQPWEYIADVLGGVTRTNVDGSPYQYMQGADMIAEAYWWYTRLP